MTPEETANAQLRDAMVRHQIGLMRVSESLKKRILALLNASEADLRQKIEAIVAKIGDSPMNAPMTLKRLEQLEREVRAIRSAAFDEAYAEWRSELSALVEHEAEFSAAAVSASVPVVLQLITPAPSFLQSIVDHHPFEGRTLEHWKETLTEADIQRITQQVRIGLVQGETVEDISRRVVGSMSLNGTDGVTEISRRDASTITRTAINSFANEARSELYQANADVISEELFVATLDSRTTVVCAGNDGKRFPVGQGPRPPLHLNCRSLRVAVIDGKVIGNRPYKRSTERELVGEFASENDLGNLKSRDALPHGWKGKYDSWSRGRIRELTGQAPAATSYSDFLKRQTNAFQEEVLGVTKAKLFRDGKLPLDRFVDRNGNELTLHELAAREAAAFRAAGLDPKAF